MFAIPDFQAKLIGTDWKLATALDEMAFCIIKQKQKLIKTQCFDSLKKR